MSLVYRRVIVPPYCGAPRLSHQLPIAEVVVGFVEVCTILGVVSGGAVVSIVLVEIMEVVTGVVDLDVVEALQDDKIIDITMRQVSGIQIIPLFI